MNRDVISQAWAAACRGVSGFSGPSRSTAPVEPVDAAGDGDGGEFDPADPDFDMPDTTREEMLDTVQDKRPLDKRFIDMGDGTKLFFPARYDPTCRPPKDTQTANNRIDWSKCGYIPE